MKNYIKDLKKIIDFGDVVALEFNKGSDCLPDYGWHTVCNAVKDYTDDIMVWLDTNLSHQYKLLQFYEKFNSDDDKFEVTLLLELDRDDYYHLHNLYEEENWEN